MADEEGNEETAQIFDVDPEQLAQLLSQSADGTAQLIDEHGNTITLTAEQFAEAGINLQALDGGDGQVLHLPDGQYIQGDDGQLYLIESDDHESMDMQGGSTRSSTGRQRKQQQQAMLPGIKVMPASGIQQNEPQPGPQRRRSRLSNSEIMAAPQSSGGPNVIEKDVNLAMNVMETAPNPDLSGLCSLAPLDESSTGGATGAVVEPGGPLAAAEGSRRGGAVLAPPTTTPGDRIIDSSGPILGGDHLQQQQQQNKPIFDEYRRLLIDREARLAELEQKLKETTEQNVIMAHALVNTCKSQEVEVVVQNADGRTNKRQIVSVRRSGPGEVAPDGSYLVTGETGDTHIVTPGATGRGGRIGPYSGLLRHQDVFQIGMLPYQCDQCPRRFVQEHHLKRHQEMAHAKKRPFYCHYCNRDLYLASETHFQGHMRMQHKQEMETEAEIDGREDASGRPHAMNRAPMDEDEPEEEPDWDALEAKKDYEKMETDEVSGHGDADYKCTLCNKEFLTMADLKKHAKDDHNVIVEEEKNQQDFPKSTSKNLVKHFRCLTCEKMFTKQEFLDKHRLAHVDQQPFPCQFCTRRFKWKENLLRHNQWHVEKIPYKCVYCSKGFASQARLDAHLKTQHGMNKSATKDGGGGRKQQPQPQREHECPMCQKSFYDKETLAKHMRVHGGVIYPCTECDKKFIAEKFLRSHMVVHTQTRDFTCEHCNKIFSRPSALKAHRYLHGDRPYKCLSCRRTFRRWADLKSHEKLHTEIKTYGCDVCGRSFRQKINLEIHSRIHQGLKPFQCSSCQRSFNRLEHLQTHVNAHKGIRPFPCPHCDRAFNAQTNLAQHLRVHEKGQRPFQCGTCGRWFQQRQHLAKHLKSHTKNTDIQYVIIWEKGGALQEATIITDGVSQDATAPAPGPDDENQAPPPPTSTNRNSASAHQQGEGGVGGGGVIDQSDHGAAAAPPTRLTTNRISQSQYRARGLPRQQPIRRGRAGAGGGGATAAAVQSKSLRVSAAAGTGQSTTAPGGVVGGSRTAPSAAAPASNEGVDAAAVLRQQLQLVDEEGNPLNEQLLVLGGDQGADGTGTILDPQTLLALAEGQGEDGTIYISEENLQALAEQGVVFSYQD